MTEDEAFRVRLQAYADEYVNEALGPSEMARAQAVRDFVLWATT